MGTTDSMTPEGLGGFMRNGFDPELSFGITFSQIGAGLENLGNTCFINSVLQCLTYTEPLAAYLQSGTHQSSCQIAGFCALCAIQKHVSQALHATGSCLVPADLVSNLRCISRTFRYMRQEDAHEYMVRLLESMHKCCLLTGVSSESPSANEKSLVHKIFGGLLQSQVRCMQCSHCTNKYEPFLDLSLDIEKADTLQKALEHFTENEPLDDGAKLYQCRQCKQKVSAVKQLTVYEAPYVLTIHLKRFCAYDPRKKINKEVVFSPTLDLKPFVSGSHEGSLMYNLYGVLVHAGRNTRSGHYYCYVRTSTGMWYNLDDDEVVQVNERTVLEQNAYMLFYVRERELSASKKPCNLSPNERMDSHTNGKNMRLALPNDLEGVPKNGSLEQYVDGEISATSRKDALDKTKEPNKVPCIDSTTATMSATQEVIMSELTVSPLLNDTKTASQSEVIHSPLPVVSCDNAVGSPGTDRNASNEEVVPSDDVSISADCIMVKNPDDEKPVIADDGKPEIVVSCDNADGSLGTDKIASSKEVVPSDDVSNSTACIMVKNPDDEKPVIAKKSPPMGDEFSMGASLMSDSSRHDSDSIMSSIASAEEPLPSPVSRNTTIDQMEVLETSAILESERRSGKPFVITMRLSTNVMCGSFARLCKRKLKQSIGTNFKSESYIQKNLETAESTSETVSVAPPRKRKRKSPSKEKLVDPVKEELHSKNTPSKITRVERNTKSDSDVVVINKPVKCMLSNASRGDVTMHCVRSGSKKVSSLQTVVDRVVRCDGTLSSNEPMMASMTCESTRSGHVPDEWDEEYDRGKKKKVKLSKDPLEGNPFQVLAYSKATPK